jgi:citrate lyase subunit beta / citryl-CoA lyase
VDPVSYLFVPATKPERFAKAIASGADRVIIDLEDAVVADQKGQALQALDQALRGGLPSPVHVRINAVGTPWFDHDLALLESLPEDARGSLSGVVVPKIEDANIAGRIRRALGARVEVLGLVESAVGLSKLRPISTSGIDRLALGAVDLSFDLGAEINSPTIDYAYAALVVESRLAQLPAPVASPPLSLHNSEATEASSARLKAAGMGGQLCIHPQQVQPIHRGFLPSAEQIAWANRVLASDGGATQVDGQMVDKPVRDKAQRILGRCRLPHTSPAH